MEFFAEFLRILDWRMATPEAYGWFHLMWFALSIIAAIVLCATHKKGNSERVKKVIRIVAITVFVLEIYKMINYSFDYKNGVEFDFQWYAFPFQFCSTPMYIGLLAGFTKNGKFHKALVAYLGTFALFAGLCVMFHPNDIYISTIGINIQTSICHGSMISVGIYILYSEYVELKHKTILGAAAVFSCCLGIAVLLNEVMFYSGILGGETFNMFYVSRHFEGTLPVYSSVQAYVPYPWSLIIYILGFTLASYIVLLLAIIIKAVVLRVKGKNPTVKAEPKKELLEIK